ncbi:MAG TPA: BtpA/SgcQ family protein [Candidatus Korarchaeota archaeon]|nr:BtpA/SgcQ family protein [Candidatus Korarchaeota archaeon]
MSRFDKFYGLFESKKPIIGMVHLPPLPGSPRYDGNLDYLIKRAISDAIALEEGGVNGLIVENYGDKPFRRDRISPETICAMTLILKEVLEATSLPTGINVLRSDCVSAMAIASVAGAKFIRCNVFTDTLVTDQGIIQPCAWEVLTLRSFLRSRVMVFADVLSKHAKPLVHVTIEESARNAAYRGGADAIIVTGIETGASPDPENVKKVKEAVPDVPVLIGSGLNPENAKILLRHADGAIVGTFFKEKGFVENKVDRERVKTLMKAIKTI